MINVKIANIITLPVDAIVNAADTRLSGGGGIDKVIQSGGGPELKRACKAIGHCDEGVTVVTRGYNLPCKYVFHTVGPRWKGGEKGEDGKLASCYRTCMQKAIDMNLSSIAFCCISTGVFKFPKDRAAKIALSTIKEFADSGINVTICCFSATDQQYYIDALRAKQ